MIEWIEGDIAHLHFGEHAQIIQYANGSTSCIDIHGMQWLGERYETGQPVLPLFTSLKEAALVILQTAEHGHLVIEKKGKQFSIGRIADEQRTKAIEWLADVNSKLGAF